MYGSPMIWLPAQMTAWTEAGAEIGAAARPLTKRAIEPVTRSCGFACADAATVLPPVGPFT